VLSERAEAMRSHLSESRSIFPRILSEQLDRRKGPVSLLSGDDQALFLAEHHTHEADALEESSDTALNQL